MNIPDKLVQRHLIWVPLFFLLACQSEPQEKVQALLLNAAHSMVFYPALHNGVAILPVRDGEQDKVIAIDIVKGDTLWTSSIKRPENVYYNFTAVQIEDTLYVPIGNHIHKWCFCDAKPQRIPTPVKGEMQAHLTMVEDNLHTVVYEPNLYTHWMLALQTGSGTWDTIKQHVHPEGRKVSIRPPQIFINDVNEKKFTSPLIDYASRDTAYSFVLYWSEKEQLDSIKAYPPNNLGVGAGRMAVLWEDQAIYLVHDQIVALDMEQGKESWRLPLPGTMLTSKPFLLKEKGLLICALENKRIYAIDLREQSILWDAGLAGTPSRCFIKDSIVAVIGGSDGRYYEFNLEYGDLEFQSPKRTVFQRPMYIDQEVAIVLSKGKWWVDTDLRNILKSIQE
jgi:outer membrane protein assembly factor BamB